MVRNNLTETASVRTRRLPWYNETRTVFTIPAVLSVQAGVPLLQFLPAFPGSSNW
jgi:hypothetical protein